MIAYPFNKYDLSKFRVTFRSKFTYDEIYIECSPRDFDEAIEIVRAIGQGTVQAFCKDTNPYYLKAYFQMGPHRWQFKNGR